MRGQALLAASVLLACSDLNSAGGGAVALELQLPSPAVIEPGDTLDTSYALKARVLDVDGHILSVPVVWRILDDTLVLVDSSPARITTLLTTGVGRAQARAGSILSDPVTFTVHGPSDTLVLTGDDTLRVLSGDTASAPLLAAVQSFTPSGTGVQGTVITFTVVNDTAAAGRVRFENNQLTLRATTDASGEPAKDVTLRRVGPSQPDSVIVSVTASRPSSPTRLVAGSGQQFIVRFDP